jgi:hypothetical protein
MDIKRDDDNRKLAEWLGLEPVEGNLPDFFEDEELSAMLLDRLPEPNLWVESLKNEPKLWACEPDMMQEEPERNPNYVVGMHADRKTCIAITALRWIKANG